MDTFLSLLEAIRLRPGMYLGEPTIESLDAFIMGWRIASDEKAITDAQLWYDFYEWISSRFKVEGTLGWMRPIRMYSSDSVDALDQFFKYWDEYVKEATSGGV